MQRLFVSIESQTFKNFEVIVTDDSNDESVEIFVNKYSKAFKIGYYKNLKTLGTPENWNEAIRKSNGKWIKLMHDDDWFADVDALKIFYESTLQNPDCSFIFSAYNNVTENGQLKDSVRLHFTGDGC